MAALPAGLSRAALCQLPVVTIWRVITVSTLTHRYRARTGTPSRRVSARAHTTLQPYNPISSIHRPETDTPFYEVRRVVWGL